MAVLTDQNLANYKKYLGELETQVKAWPNYLSNASDLINKSTGSEFRNKYTKGQKATDNVLQIIKYLQSLKNDFDKIIQDANTFYTTSYNASKK